MKIKMSVQIMIFALVACSLLTFSSARANGLPVEAQPGIQMNAGWEAQTAHQAHQLPIRETLWVEKPPPGLPEPGPGFLGPEITISNSVTDEYSPAVAYNSVHGEYLVVWEQWFAGDKYLYASRFSERGKLLGFFTVSTLANKKTNPDVAYDRINDRYLVVYTYDFNNDGSDTDIYGRFIPWDGPSASWPDFPIRTPNSMQGYPQVAYGESQGEYIVVWREWDNGVPSAVKGQRIPANASNVLGPLLNLTSGTNSYSSPSIAYNLARNEYLVAFSYLYTGVDWDVRAIRLRGDGVPLPIIGGGEFDVAAYVDDWEESPSVAACDQADQYVVAWQSDENSGGADYAIYARLLNGEAVPGEIYTISTFSDMEIEADITCSRQGTEYLLTWQYNYVNDKYGVWGARIFPNGDRTLPFEIINPGWVDGREHPAVAGGRNNYLVAWEHQVFNSELHDIHGRLLGYSLFLPAVRK